MTPPLRQRVLWYLSVVVIAIGASATSVANGFALDDVAIVADNARVHSLAHWWRLFAVPYWPPQYGPSLYRPLVTLAFAAQWAVSAGAPWVFHLSNVLLYAALSVLVLALFTELVSIPAAGIAAALFAAHPVHVEAVANVVGQTELLAGLPMVAACIVYVRARRAGAIRPTTTAVIAGLFALACLAKEHGLFLPLLLAVIELLAVRVDEPTLLTRTITRLRATASLVVTLTVVGIAYLAVRAAVLESLLGEMHVVPVYGLRRVYFMLAIVPHWVRLLVWPAHLSADYSPQQIAVPAGPGAEIVPGLAILAALAVMYVALGAPGGQASARRTARLGLAWMGVAMLPVSNLLSVMGLAERTLLLPSVGAMLVVGVGIATLWERRPALGGVARVGLTTVVAGVVLAGVARSRERQRVWRDDSTLFTQTVEDAPLSYRAQFFYGQMLFAQGRRAEGERHLKLAIALNPTPADVSPLNYLATQYRDAGMCAQALPLYERALVNDAARPDVRYGLAACLLSTGRVAESRRLAEDGVKRGDLKALFLRLLAQADSASTRGG